MWRTQSEPARLGEILVRKGVLSPERLREALEIQRKSGKKLGEVLAEVGFCSPETVADALAEQAGASRAPEGFWEQPPAPEVPPELALRLGVFPMRVEGGRVVVAGADPLDVAAADALRYTLGLEAEIQTATPQEVERALRRWYGAQVSALQEPEEEEEPAQDSAEGPAARAVSEIIAGALAEGASDVHVEPRRDCVLVRYRMDGMLREVMRLPRGLHAPLVSRIKVLSGMDIADRRVPQDGRIRVREPREADVRVSTLPTVLGEAAVLRILDRARTVPRLEALGYSGEALARIRRAAARPYGMILVTGPTGSGKTTTLYAVLAEVAAPHINVIAVEDPPEYELPGVRQVAVNPKAGLTFATALRAILRQDPDVVMVGEIRDSETARIAVQAALTGHLVLSTLHTNDAASAPARLVDMGAEPYLVASCLLVVVAQRLARTVCPRCAEEYVPEPDSPAWGFLNGGEPRGMRLKRGRGCPECGRTGYRGRTAVAEAMAVSRGIRDLIRRGADADRIRDLAVAEGMVPLAEDARKKALEGITTPEEAMRVAASAED
ncbi:MAG: GspE/PulE family protein [Moorellales bacterium]